uniref:SOS response-associated peptidase family protein n=1 Tax=Paenibacillus sp. FSL W8-0426 TaxID=2921714 RepID=UPI00403F21E1
MGLRWGLVPSWANDDKIGNKMVNARAKTLAEKPAFKLPVGNRRCIVLCSGFFY